MSGSHERLLQRHAGISWYAVAVALALQFAFNSLWTSGPAYSDPWIAQAFGIQYPAGHDSVIAAPRLKYVHAGALVLLAVLVGRLHWPESLGTLKRGVLYSSLIWLVVMLPIEIHRNAEPAEPSAVVPRDAVGEEIVPGADRVPREEAIDAQDVLLFDATGTLICWLIAGIVLGAWPKLAETNASNSVTHNAVGKGRENAR